MEKNRETWFDETKLNPFVFQSNPIPGADIKYNNPYRPFYKILGFEAVLSVDCYTFVILMGELN